MLEALIIDKYKLVQHPFLFSMYACNLPIEFKGAHVTFRDVHKSSVIVSCTIDNFVAYKQFTPESLRMVTVPTFLKLLHEFVLEQHMEYTGVQKEMS